MNQTASPSPANLSLQLEGDRALLEAFRVGDPDLLTRLYLTTVPSLRALLYACGLRGAADVDDALQTTYARAFAQPARASYAGLSPFSSYLKTIARNVVRDLKKSGRSRFEVLDPEAAEAARASGEIADPEAAAVRAEGEVLREKFLGRLPELERRIYDACFVDGKAEREAADALSITRHRLRNGVDAIRDKLARFVKEHRLDE
ncbi:MAG: RNA polymerase sigma factor [Deltaproteobacteria bacterium]|nr:RNA polymerase sigma factor [Deltaproteobacteria bacterium]